MITMIREMGIVPLVSCGIPSWSIQERTDTQYWFSEDELGPWDWKINALEEGDILYAKALRRKAVFLTRECYCHLMNYRRSIPYYRMALQEDYDASTISDRLMKHLSPILLESIRNHGSMESLEMREELEYRTSKELRSRVGGHMDKYLLPRIKKQALDFLTQYLEMGTWTTIGGFQRVYRGPNLVYQGWQKSFVTTPEEFLDTTADGLMKEAGCSPEQSLETLVRRVESLVGPGYRDEIIRLLQ